MCAWAGLCLLAQLLPSAQGVRELAALRTALVNDGALNAQAYGAVGDGKHDDGPALQRAVDAATMMDVSLFVPNGTYAVYSSISIPISEGHGTRSPLRLVGGGTSQTSIFAAAPMNALLNFSSCCPAAAPRGQKGVQLSQLSLSANRLANFTILAPGITRSRLSHVKVTGALITGASLGYGWCLYIEDCTFSFNEGIGLHTYNSANNIDVINSLFEGNGGPAVYFSAGAQINVEGNVMEGNNGPAIVAMGSRGLNIVGNYFERNNNPMDWPQLGPLVLRPEPGASPGAPDITSTSDILLIGGPSFHDGDSDVANWPAGPTWTYGKTYPCQGVTIAGGYHHPGVNHSAIFANAVIGLSLSGNTAGTIDAFTTATGNVALVETGLDSSLFEFKRALVHENTGWSSKHDGAYGPQRALSNSGVLRATAPLANGREYKEFTGGMDFHTVEYLHPTELSVPRNLASAAPRDWQVTPAGNITAGGRYDGREVSVLRCAAAADGCTATIVQAVDLAVEPGFAGQLVYVVLQARVASASTGLAISIDNGGGGWRRSSDKLDGDHEWRLHTFEAYLPWSGTARFGVQLFGPGGKVAQAVGARLEAELGHVVIGRAGSEWSRL